MDLNINDSFRKDNFVQKWGIFNMGNNGEILYNILLNRCFYWQYI